MGRVGGSAGGSSPMTWMFDGTTVGMGIVCSLGLTGAAGGAPRGAGSGTTDYACLFIFVCSPWTDVMWMVSDRYGPAPHNYVHMSFATCRAAWAGT